MSPRRTALVLALSAALAGACVTNPVTGRQELSLVSPAQERQIGAEGHEAVLQVLGEYGDADLRGYVRAVGEKVAEASHQPELDWHFTLLDDPAVNAFAMPGGYIFVTRGILVHLNSEAQLAGVLGHEVAHVTARHSASRMTQEQLAGLGLGLASVFSETFRRYGGVVEVALGLLFLRYGRDDETEADALAVRYALGAGFDPRQIPRTYAMLQRVQPAGAERLPTFLSTHPDPGDRQQRTLRLANAAVQERGAAGLVVDARDHNQRMAGVVYGDDPREGFFDDNHYFHPGLRFQIVFPPGWYYQNTRAAVVAVAPDQSSGMQLTVVDPQGRSPSAHVARLGASGAIADAEGDLETVDGLPAWIGRIAANAGGSAPVPLWAAFIRKADDQMFQVLGETQGGDDPQILASMRSFGALADPARIDVGPARVQVARVRAAGTFEQVVAGLGTPREWIEASAALNDVRRGQTIAAGTVIKFIVPGERARPAAPRREGRAARSR